MLDKQTILSRARHVDLHSDRLGQTVRIKRLSAGEMLALGRDNLPPAESQLRMVAACVLGEDDQPLFSTEELREVDADAYLALGDLVRSANGLDEGIEKK